MSVSDISLSISAGVSNVTGAVMMERGAQAGFSLVTDLGDFRRTFRENLPLGVSSGPFRESPARHSLCVPGLCRFRRQER